MSWLLGVPERFLGFLELAAPDVAAWVVPGSLRALESRLVASTFRAVEEDVVYEGRLRRGRGRGTVRILALVAHQSAHEPLMAFRVLNGITQLWARDLREQEARGVARSRMRLPPIVPVVFHTGRRPWAPRRLRELVEQAVVPELEGVMPDVDLRVLDLPSEAEATLLGAATPVGPILALFRAQHRSAGAFRATLGRVVARLPAVVGDAGALHQLVWFCLQLVLHRRPRVEQVRLKEALLSAAPRGEVDAMIESYAEELQRLARLEMARKCVLDALEARFEGRSGEVAEEVEALDGVEVLERLHREAVVTPSVDAFRRLLDEL